jgi:hypothetical protein
MAMLGGAPDDVVRSTITLLVMLVLLAWIVAFNTEVGLPAIGASWRWPQIAAFFIAAGVQVALLLGAGALDDRGLSGVVGGVGMIALFVVVSFVPGRESRG